MRPVACITVLRLVASGAAMVVAHLTVGSFEVVHVGLGSV